MEQDEFNLYKINTIIHGVKKTTIKIKLNNRPIRMEYDSGARNTIITKRV